MLLNNPSRIQYHERYQSIIEDYNSQQDRANIERTFDELMKLVQSMDQEERRYVWEGFSAMRSCLSMTCCSLKVFPMSTPI